MKAISLLTVAGILLGTSVIAQTATVGNDNVSTSAVILNSGGTPDTQTIRTHPDVSVAPVMTAPQSCFVGQASVGLGSLLFGGGGASWSDLDEGCEQRADSAHLANLAATRVKLFGDLRRAGQLLDLAEARMTMTRDEWVKTWPDSANVVWEQYWRP